MKKAKGALLFFLMFIIVPSYGQFAPFMTDRDGNIFLAGVVECGLSGEQLMDNTRQWINIKTGGKQGIRVDEQKGTAGFAIMDLMSMQANEETGITVAENLFADVLIECVEGVMGYVIYNIGIETLIHGLDGGFVAEVKTLGEYEELYYLSREYMGYWRERIDMLENADTSDMKPQQLKKHWKALDEAYRMWEDEYRTNRESLETYNKAYSVLIEFTATLEDQLVYSHFELPVTDSIVD